MAHFAKVENNTVIDITVADQEFINTLPDSESWIQTSYNTRGNVHFNPDTGEPDGLPALRGNYAFIGGIYDAVNDVFYNQQPFPSWHIGLETNWIWEAPVPYPQDGKTYFWDESTLSWIYMVRATPQLLTPVETLP